MVEELSQMLVKKSLHWPTKRLDKEFPNAYKRIPHERTTSDKKSLLTSTSVERWADRVMAAFGMVVL